jgi:hypothetical protein
MNSTNPQLNHYSFDNNKIMYIKLSAPVVQDLLRASCKSFIPSSFATLNTLGH